MVRHGADYLAYYGSKWGYNTGGDYHFMALNQRFKKPSWKGRTTTATWISDTTWRLADQRAALGRKLISKQGEFRTMTQRFQ